jgi:hypothetical protein
MKTFKYFIFESYKLPAIQTVFGARSTEKKYYDCLKDYYNECKIVPYSTLKGIAKAGRFSKKYEIKITYV